MSKFELYKAHILSKINQGQTDHEPFYHMFIEGIFPDELYESIKKRVFYYKYSGDAQDRHQDSKNFVNSKYNLMNNDDPETKYIFSLFSDPEIKTALLKKFYLDPDPELEKSLQIHKEFEYMYTAKDRFQNIHIDIPPKFLSFVFYFPEEEVSEEEEHSNATILYGKDLKPRHKARYKSNSLCSFASHYYSYHGFSSTIDRTVLVMFYINKEFKAKWIALRSQEKAPFNEFRDMFQERLEKYPLIEYESGREKILDEKVNCRVNAAKGRVML